MAFCVPELYGSAALGLDTLVDFHFHNNPEYPFALLTPRHDPSITVISWREMAEAVHRAGRSLQASIGSSTNLSAPSVVAILVPDDGLVYTALQLAIIRIGLIVSTLLAMGLTNSDAFRSSLCRFQPGTRLPPFRI